MRPRVPAILVLATALAVLPSAGCSIRRLAVTKLGDALAESGTAYASDDDPELIREAMPFTLKLIESILDQNPRHSGLLTAAAGGFTQYAWAFVQQDADEIEDTDLARARDLRIRARNLYLRAHRYGVRGLEIAHAGFGAMLGADSKAAALMTTAHDLPLLYWTAASLLASISLSKDDPERIAELPVVDALMARALALDPDYSHGALHELMISYEAGRTDAMGGSAARARGHFKRAMELSGGMRASPLVSLAEMVSVRDQNRPEFQTLLNQALAVDPNARPEWRLENLLMQRRARWLLARVDLLFAE